MSELEYLGHEFDDGRKVGVAKMDGGEYAFYFVNKNDELTQFKLSAESTGVLVDAILKLRELG